jgi:asparagine synthase (glutamine-hydrolysing)
VKPAGNLIWIERISVLAAEAGSRVLLTGERGDAAYSWRGDGTVWELAMKGRLRRMFAQASLEARWREVSVGRVLAGSVRHGLQATLGRPKGADVHPPSVDFVRHRPSLQLRTNEYAQRAGSRELWVAMLSAPRHSWLADPVLQWGLEWRDPTADRRLLERLLQYPQAAFRFAGQPRGLAREAAAGLLPERVRYRRTRGAQAPEAPSRIAAHLYRYREGLDRMRTSRWCLELFDFTAVERALDAIAGGARDYYLASAVERAFSAGLFLADLEGKA